MIAKEHPIDRLSNFFRNWKIGYVIILGLSIRLIIAPFSAHPLDVYVWFETGENIIGGRGFYGNSLYSYMPIWALILTPFVSLYSVLAPIFHATPVSPPAVLMSLGYPSVPLVVDWLFALLIKIPIFICDVGICLLLYRFIARLHGSERLGVMAGAAYFLSPFTLWVSAFWGMFDALPVLLTFLAFMLLVEEKYEFSGLVTGFAVAAKYFALLIVPIALVTILRRKPDKLKSYLLLLALPIVVVSLPFLILEPYDFVKAVISPAAGSTVGQLNLWAIISFLTGGVLPWYFAVADSVFLIFLYAFIWKRCYSRMEPNSSTEFLTKSILLNLCIFYLFFRLLSVQYLLWAQPFLILAYSFYESGNKLHSAGLPAILFSAVRSGLLFLAPVLTIPWASFGPKIEFLASFNDSIIQLLLNGLSVFLWSVVVVILLYDTKYLFEYVTNRRIL